MCCYMLLQYCHTVAGLVGVVLPSYKGQASSMPEQMVCYKPSPQTYTYSPLFFIVAYHSLEAGEDTDTLLSPCVFVIPRFPSYK